MKYNILYRGPLSSCNYACGYCPFAKRAETHADLAEDRAALQRFLDWIADQTADRFGILFTPWGEALIRSWYQEALCRLTHLPHIDKAAIQTNLSAPLSGWLERCRLDRLALWSTYHPGEVSRASFVAKVRKLRDLGVQLSVGVVGLREHFEEIARLRDEVPSGVYVWINAFKRVADYYSQDEHQFLSEVDPQFAVNAVNHASLGQGCWSGETTFTVDGAGLMRRCHFVAESIGCIHDPDWRSCLRPRTCPKETCGCFIGYVHLKRLKQETVYGGRILERIALTPCRS